MMIVATGVLLLVVLALLIHVARIRASDRYIDQLAAGVSTADVEDELTQLLTEWRRDIVDTPYPPIYGGREAG